MDLFNHGKDRPLNRLPRDGVVHYYRALMDRQDADLVFEKLALEIAWDHDIIKMFGKTITTRRKVAWYGDDAFDYTYSKSTKTALPWTPLLKRLKSQTEALSGTRYNSCLLNYYDDGNVGMGWHSDDEKELLKDGAIASLSFGAERSFVFKHKVDQDKVTLHLEHGSLLVMKGKTQEFWSHSLPVRKRVSEPRINLTFRTIGHSVSNHKLIHSEARHNSGEMI